MEYTLVIKAHESLVFFFGSPELSFSDCLLSVVHLSVIFSHFHLLLQNHWVNSSKLKIKHPWVNGIQVCSNEGPRPFQREDNSEVVKML